MEWTERLLLDALRSDSANIINADWVIQEVETEVIEPTNETGKANNILVIKYENRWYAFEIFPGIPVVDNTIDVEELRTLLTEMKSLTQTLTLTLRDAAVPSNGVLHLDHVTLLGGTEVKDNSVFDSLTVSQLNGESVPILLKDAVR